MSPPFDTRQVRRTFSRAAQHYQEHAVLQREVEDRLLERCVFVETPPQRVLDLGAGPGRASAALRRRWPKAQVISMDLALPMLREARHTITRFRMTLEVFGALADGSGSGRFVRVSELDALAMPAPHRKLARALQATADGGAT